MPSLKPFEKTPLTTALRLKGEMAWTGSTLEVHFSLSGEVGRIKGLTTHRGGPTDAIEGLWESTCFEAFISPKGSNVYYEFNGAPDGRWMVYRFEGERAGRTIRREARPLVFESQLGDRFFTLRVQFDFGGIDELSDNALSANVTAILETKDGGKTHWSLAHDEKPDFHKPAHRLLNLPGA